MSEPTQLDCMGEACPLPLLHLHDLIETLTPGTLVEIHNDDAGSKVDIPVWCRMHGHEFLERTDRPEGGWRYRLRVQG